VGWWTLPDSNRGPLVCDIVSLPFCFPRILFLLTGAIGDSFGRFRLVMCQPDGDGFWLSFGVGGGGVQE
jgi:hypothetical protein